MNPPRVLPSCLVGAWDRQAPCLLGADRYRMPFQEASGRVVYAAREHLIASVAIARPAVTDTPGAS
jgi:hypothetical protein